jgi:putative ABC transport system permease protein
MAWSLPDVDREAMLGDLAEEFAGRATRSGYAPARHWYWRQLRRSLVANLSRRFQASTRSETNRRHFPESVMTDLRDAVRALRAAPGFTVVALIVLTLGIGATTAIFSVVDAVVLRGLPFDEHDRLVAVGERHPPGPMNPPNPDPEALNSIAPQNYLDWVARQQVFESIAAVTTFMGALTLQEPGSEPEDVQALRVTASVFDVLRVRPAIGRAFTAENEVDGRQRVVILSDGLWRRRFGGDPALVGRTIPLEGASYEVVGVMPPGVAYPLNAVRPTDLWLPYVPSANERIRTPNNFSFYLQVLARLKPGVSIRSARTQMDQIAAALEQAHPDWNKNAKIGVRPLRDHVVGASTKSWMLMLLGAVGIVLLIACANVANLLLARASTREREIAVRAALGAGRWRLIRQLLVESLMLSIVGTLLATLLAVWGVQVLRSAMPEGMPRVATIAIDLRVLTATAALSLLTGVPFGIVPALQLSRPNLATALKDGTRTAGTGRGRLLVRSALVVAEVALAVVLLVGAALFIGSFISLMRVDPGFDSQRLLTLQVTPRMERGKRPLDTAATFGQILERLSQTPGVTDAAVVAGGIPLGTGNASGVLTIPGRTVATGDPINMRVVSADYHKTLRMPLRSGRLFNAADRNSGQKVVIINESTAKRYFPGEDPLGRSINLANDDLTIIGVVGDVRQSSLELDARTEAYLLLGPVLGGKGFNELVIRTSGAPYDVLPAVKSVVLAVLRDVPIRNVRTMEEIVARQVAQRRLNMLLLGTFGLLGLVISAAGIYGVLGYVVAQRTREIGVRMALGATHSTVVAMVLKNAGGLVAAGLIVGSGGAWYLSATARMFLFGLQPHEPRAFVAALGVLCASALIASVIPARRAASVDPVVALRAE